MIRRKSISRRNKVSLETKKNGLMKNYITNQNIKPILTLQKNMITIITLTVLTTSTKRC